MSRRAAAVPARVPLGGPPARVTARARLGRMAERRAPLARREANLSLPVRPAARTRSGET